MPMITVSDNLSFLRVNLQDWIDADLACYIVGAALSIFDKNTKVEDLVNYNLFRKHKWIWCGNNKMARTLYGLLNQFVDMGILEYDEEEMKYRWNSTYVEPKSEKLNIIYGDISE